MNNRVLVVDDDIDILESYKIILSKNNKTCDLEKGKALFPDDTPMDSSCDSHFETFLAENGKKAIEIIKAQNKEDNPISVAFIDMKMPGLNGAETSKLIWETDPRVKIVIVTAYSEFTPQDIITVTGRKDLFYLRKPFNHEEINQFAKTLSHMWELERINKNHVEIMEKTIAEKTEALRNTNLQLEKLDLVKTEFIKYLAHEINTPLNWISVTAIMDKEELSQENKVWLDLVEKGFNRLSGLITEMISYFDIKSIKTLSIINDIQLKQIISKIILYQNQQLQKKNLDIKIDIPDELKIDADPNLLEILLTTIISNAFIYSPEKGEISISSMETNNELTIKVKDKGCGIEEKIIKNIFDPFFNIETRRHNNTGYGLSLPKAKEIALLHSWNLEAESSGLGKGSTFKLRIPNNV